MVNKKILNVVPFSLYVVLTFSSPAHAMGDRPPLHQQESDISACDFQQVKRVIDGDTFETQNGHRIRLIGVDTPEIADPRKPVQWFAREASKKMKEWIDEKTVCLTTDRDATMNTDKYGRLLRYVWKYPAEKPSQNEEAFFVNAELIRQGYAFAYTRFPFQYLEEFRDHERHARKNSLGLWDRKKQEAWERQYEANKKLAGTCGQARSICPEDAAKHRGEFMTVRFFVEKSHDSGKAVFLNSTINYRNPDSFTAVIFEKNRKNFPPYPADLYWGKTVDVSGRIVEYKGRAEIILTTANQIKIIS